MKHPLRGGGQCANAFSGSVNRKLKASKMISWEDSRRFPVDHIATVGTDVRGYHST